MKHNSSSGSSEEVLKSLLSYIVKSLESGKNQAVITRDMLDKGLNPRTIDSLFKKAYEVIDIHRRKIAYERYRNQIAIGIALIFFASLASAGSQYFFYGGLIVGACYSISGIVGIISLYLKKMQ